MEKISLAEATALLHKPHPTKPLIYLDSSGFGYDFANLAWIVDNRYVDCDHVITADCGCFGRKHKGLQAC